MFTFDFKPKFSILIVLSFMAFTIVGTLLHEFGHIVVAKSLGYDTVLHYGSMNYYYVGYFQDDDVIKREELLKEFRGKKEEEITLKEKEAFESLSKKIANTFVTNDSDGILVTLGGPLQTIITSFFGLLILSFRKSKEKVGFKFIDWLAVFLGLFILREIFNFLGALIQNIIYNKSYFHGDEFILSRYFLNNEWIIPLVTFVFGFIIAIYIIFQVIPIRYRFSFVLSGLFGSGLGFYMWFRGVGEFLIP